MLSSSYASNGLEVSITLEYETDQLVANVVTDHYRRVDLLSEQERDHVRKVSQDLWFNKKIGRSPFDNHARVYHGMIL